MKRSSEANTPNTPEARMNRKAKNSRGRSSMPQEIITPVTMTMPVNSTSGADMPSTPKCRLMPRNGTQLYCSMNW